MKSLTERNKRFFDFASKYYDFGIMRRWLNGILEEALRKIEVKRNARILDAGCGTGNLLLLLSKRNELKLYGIDISPEMLKIARKKLGKRAVLKNIEVEKINFKNKFDYVFSTEAFHHYSKQDKAVWNFYSALKKKGKLIIVDLDFGKILNFIFHYIEPGNSRMNSASDFEKIFEQNKFKNIKQEKIGMFAIMTLGEK